MHSSHRVSPEYHAVSAQYCDRCARRASQLYFDDVTQRELCQDCSDQLERRRYTAPIAKKGTAA